MIVSTQPVRIESRRRRLYAAGFLVVVTLTAGVAIASEVPELVPPRFANDEACRVQVVVVKPDLRNVRRHSHPPRPRPDRVRFRFRVTMGDPVNVVETWLNELRDKEWIERYDMVEAIDFAHETGNRVVMYYVVDPWDVVSGPPTKAPRELLRFEFIPSDANVRALRDELENLPGDDWVAAQREQVERAILEMSNRDTFQLFRFERVTRRDTDFAKYMPPR